MSNSSMASGSGSRAGLDSSAGADAGGVETIERPGGEDTGAFRAGTSGGSSVEVAISSSRDVAASSLRLSSGQPI